MKRLLSFVATLEVARYFRHDQLCFLAAQMLYLADEFLGFLPFQNHDLLSVPRDENLIILADAVSEDLLVHYMTFIYFGHSRQGTGIRSELSGKKRSMVAATSDNQPFLSVSELVMTILNILR
jgi:hypothetical protein